MNQSNDPKVDAHPTQLSQSYERDPIQWCKNLIDLGLTKHGNPRQMVLMIARGSVLGLDAFTSLEGIYTVKNQTALGVDLMLALVERSGLIADKTHHYKGTGDQRSCTVTMTRINRSPQEYSFSVQEAKIAEIYKQGGSWTKWCDSMLYARAMSFALRREFPDVLKGIHSYEEMYVEPEPAAQVVEQPAEEPPREKRSRRRRSGVPEPVNQQAEGEEEENVIDIDKAIPAEVKPIEQLRYQAGTLKVSEGELMGAARSLRLAHDGQSLDDLPEHRINSMLKHWGQVMGQVQINRKQNEPY